MYKGKFVIIFLPLVVYITPLFGQVINDIPPTEANNRFFNEIHSQMKRPGLSINGFEIQKYEAEPGNRPLEGFIASGYVGFYSVNVNVHISNQRVI